MKGKLVKWASVYKDKIIVLPVRKRMGKFGGENGISRKIRSL